MTPPSALSALVSIAFPESRHTLITFTRTTSSVGYLFNPSSSNNVRHRHLFRHPRPCEAQCTGRHRCQASRRFRDGRGESTLYFFNPLVLLPFSTDPGAHGGSVPTHKKQTEAWNILRMHRLHLLCTLRAVVGAPPDDASRRAKNVLVPVLVQSNAFLLKNVIFSTPLCCFFFFSHRAPERVSAE